MWIKSTLCVLILIQVCTPANSVVYNKPEGARAPAGRQGGRQPSRGSVNPQLYKYLKGYYQNKQGSQSPRQYGPPKAGQAPAGRQYRPPANSVRQTPSLNNPKQLQRTNLQPKNGVNAGRFNSATSKEYLKKLRLLADLLKSRVAARAARKQQQQQQQQKPQTPPRQSYAQPQSYRQPQAAPAPRPSYAQPQKPAQPVPRPSYAQPQQPAQPAPRPSYVQPQQAAQPAPAPSQNSYRQPSQPTYVQPQPQQQPKPQVKYVNVAAPKQSGVSYQSLGLPQSGYRQPVPVTAPPPAAQPKPNEALVKLLRASYATLLPLLLNQAKMTSYGVQTIPLYGSNPYRVFGPMTYGPLPKHTSQQMSLSYSPQSFTGAQKHPFSSGGYSSYKGYGSSGGSSGSSTGSRYPAPSSGGYTGGSGGAVQAMSADITCGPISGTFCQGRAAGHYSHPASGHCFVQCDHVGKGQPRSCSPGTTWKELGPEPALFNYCA